MSISPGTMPEAEERYRSLPGRAVQGRLAGVERLAHVTVITRRHISIAILNRRAAPVMRSVSVRAMGGVRTDLSGRTSIPRLYAAGEVAGMAGGHINGRAALIEQQAVEVE